MDIASLSLAVVSYYGQVLDVIPLTMSVVRCGAAQPDTLKSVVETLVGQHGFDIEGVQVSCAVVGEIVLRTEA
ncbi:MAG: hypothetical protein AAF618_00255 [Pseudomonadota bacterium]